MTEEDAFVAAISIIAVFSLLMLLGWQVFKTWQVSIANRVNLARDQAYQELADKAVYTQQKLLEQSERLVADVTDVKSRILGIEQKLAEVD
jgi:hypothetical protein